MLTMMLSIRTSQRGVLEFRACDFVEGGETSEVMMKMMTMNERLAKNLFAVPLQETACCFVSNNVGWIETHLQSITGELRSDSGGGEGCSVAVLASWCSR
jgi:hypothetical protein